MIASVAARMAVGALARTWRADAPVTPPATAAILAVWHGQLLAALCGHRGHPITLLVSAHDDGEHLARAARAWGFRTVRGSSTRGGTAGLRGLVRALRQGRVVALTPDGPRGPARTPKPGAVAAAQMAGVPIIPVGTAASRAWRLRSWDRFELPQPFARVHVTYGAPIHVGPGAHGLERGRRELAAALDQAQSEAACRL